jgi:hypothetical protein
MNRKPLRNFLWLAILMVSTGAQSARAQAPLEPAQLPPRTMFYLIWRGAPAADVRQANSLMALWDDPDFASIRSAVATNMISASEKDASRPKLTPQELVEFASLLENSFTLGYIQEPARHRSAAATTPAETKPPAWNGMFFVYNRAGKEGLLTKTILRIRGAAKEPPRLSQVTIAGVQVLKIEHKADSSYWAENGKYAVGASEEAVMEEVLSRLENKMPQAASLAQSAAYQESQPIVGSGVLEFFLRVPDLKDFAGDSQPGPFQAKRLLDAARLDAVHSVSGHVTFEGAKTHMQAAILGDTATGTPFDIWANGQPVPATLALAPADAISYASGQVNLPGIYDMVKRIARAAFPVGQQGNADLMDTMAEKRLGMPLTDALGLFTGEFASVQTSPDLDSAKQVFFFAIRNKPETLKLFRALFGDQLTSERNEGDATLLKISLGGNQGSAGVAQWNFFNVAVTPDMVIGTSRIDTLREALAFRGKASAAASLASVPQLQFIRNSAPPNLLSLSYVDFQKVDWQAAKDHWIQETKKALAKSATGKSATGTSPQATSNSANHSEWLSQINAQIVPRHLHNSWSYSWKDAKGIHWEHWVE